MWRSGILLIFLSGGILAGQQLNCQMADVLMKCKNTQNGGFTYRNQGSEWNPEAAEMRYDHLNQEHCKPCCKEPNTSINKCPDTDLPDEDGVSYDQLRDLVGVKGWLRCNIDGRKFFIR